jgi:hypothetical protein
MQNIDKLVSCSVPAPDSASGQRVEKNPQAIKCTEEKNMRTAAIAIALIILVSAAQAKIYRWVDENGSVHFSDKPYSENAQEIIIQGTGIELEEPPDTKELKQPSTADSAETPESASEQPSAGKAAVPAKETVKEESIEEKIITEADYKVTTTIGKLGADLISISGRIGSGPKCYDLTVIATATNDNGLTATIKDQVRKSSSFGSVTYKGTAKAVGSGEDRGFWKVDSVTIRCNDIDE